MGSDWVFDLNEALDQGGATVGPLVITLVLSLKGSLSELCHSAYFRAALPGQVLREQTHLTRHAARREASALL